MFAINLPNIDGGHTNVPVEIGNITFVLGANGVGKSALMQNVYNTNVASSRRISAHRQSEIPSNMTEHSSSQIQQYINSTKSQDRFPASRYLEWNSSVRPTLLIYELLNAENLRAREVAKLVSEGQIALAEARAAKPGPLQIISDVMQKSHMPIAISADAKEALVAQKNGSDPYSISALSDGERNAFTIAGNIALAAEGSLILIDEPERHLHRSIMTPLLRQLFALRSDCAFIISTHDLDLPLEYPAANGVLVRSCKIINDEPNAWQLDVVQPLGSIEADIRADVLGGRRKVVFVEGNEETSIDAPLYSLLLPGVSIQPKGNCRAVIAHVKGLNAAENLHWLKGCGIVDKDQLKQEEVSNLENQGVFAIPWYSVESVYYHSSIQDRVARAHGELIGAEPATLLAQAKASAIASIQPHRERLVARMIERSIKTKMQAATPHWKNLNMDQMINVTIDVPDMLLTESKFFDEYITNADMDALLRRYPLRETEALAKIASALQFRNRGQYEAAALRLIKADAAFLSYVKNILFEGIIDKIATA